MAPTPEKKARAKSPAARTKSAGKKPGIHVGTEVLAKHEKWGNTLFAATVVSVNANGTVELRWLDGDLTDTTKKIKHLIPKHAE